MSSLILKGNFSKGGTAKQSLFLNWIQWPCCQDSDINLLPADQKFAAVKRCFVGLFNSVSCIDYAIDLTSSSLQK